MSIRIHSKTQLTDPYENFNDLKPHKIVSSLKFIFNKFSIIINYKLKIILSYIIVRQMDLHQKIFAITKK